MAAEQQESSFDRFCDNVSIPTAKYLTSKHNTKVRRLTWIIMLFMAALTVYQIYDRSAYYASYPINVIITESDVDTGILPAMVICPPGQFRASWANSREYGEGSGRINYIVGSIYSDLTNFEQYRDAYIALFQRKNITITEKDVDTLITDLKNINQELMDSNTSETTLAALTRLDEIAVSLQNTFPMVAAQLNSKEPAPGGLLPIEQNIWSSNQTGTTDSSTDTGNSNITSAHDFSKYREINGLYDFCATSSFRFPDDPLATVLTWDELIRQIMICRLTDSFFINDLKRVSTYPRLVNIARPKQSEVVLDCAWYNSKISANSEPCNVSSVWTPLGMCFRIAPTDGIISSLTSPGNVAYANVLIDTLAAEFPHGTTQVFFHDQDETEFAIASGGVPIIPGIKSDLTIEQMRKYIRVDKNCGTTPLRYFKNYSRDKCVWEKKMEPVETKCKCLFDRSPNFLQLAQDDIAKLEVDRDYNSSLNYCSFYDTFFCAPNAINTTDYDCPNDCENIQPEISVVTSPLDPRKTYTRLPKGFDETAALNMESLSTYGGYSNAPGSDQLYSLLSTLFQTHLALINAFWWKNRTEYQQPFYMAWYSGPYGTDILPNLNDFNNYFATDASSVFSDPIFPIEFEYSILNRTDQYFSNFTDLITDIVAKYDNALKGMTDGGSYTKQTLVPFYEQIMADLEAAKKVTDGYAKHRLLVLNTFIKDTQKLYNCTTQLGSGQSSTDCFTNYGCSKYADIFNEGAITFNTYVDDTTASNVESNLTYAKQWRPRCICELEKILQTIEIQNLTNIGIGGQIKAMLDSLMTPMDDSEFSQWTAPWGYYYKWFRKDIVDHLDDHTKSIAEAFSTQANRTDVYLITNHYLAGSNAREDLQKAHLDVAQSLQSLYSAANDIMARTTAKPHFIY